MSDADNQLGGTGGERGPDPDEVVPARDNAAPEGEDEADEDDTSRQSFPASDPPSTY